MDNQPASIPSDSFGWLLMAKQNGFEMYIAANRIQRDGNYVRIWKKTIKDKIDKWGAKYDIGNELLDCKNSKMKLLGLIAYDNNNKVNFELGADKEWTLVIPETVGGGYFEYACGR